jgi:NCAIR mutase (PurE)-related protein
MGHGPNHLEQFANLDLLRATRTGVPEVILAERKTAEQTLAIVRRVLDERGRVLISRVPAEALALLERALDGEVIWTRYAEGRTLALQRPGADVALGGGQVGVLTAGTSDIPVAEEAAALCREMGCQVHTAYDVGVAGLHRLFEPLRHMLAAPVDAIIVAAGMDGALPSVVAGLVDVPVIGLCPPRWATATAVEASLRSAVCCRPARPAWRWSTSTTASARGPSPGALPCGQPPPGEIK